VQVTSKVQFDEYNFHFFLFSFFYENWKVSKRVWPYGIGCVCVFILFYFFNF